MTRRYPILTRALALVALAVALTGCPPEIGDECELSADCSVSGDRLCDTASPNGYCTISNCDKDSCPDDAICVEYLYEPQRLGQTWCMAPCEGKGDCRPGYDCVRASSIEDANGDSIARVVDSGGDSKRFCATASN